MSWGSTAEGWWKFYHARPYLCGAFAVSYTHLYVHRISVYDDFKGRFRGVGLGSSVQDVLNVTGEIKDDGGVYVIPGYPGICFEASEEGIDSMMRPIICFSIVDEAYYQ